jgi:hypothetical protein
MQPVIATAHGGRRRPVRLGVAIFVLGVVVSDGRKRCLVWITQSVWGTEPMRTCPESLKTEADEGTRTLDLLHGKQTL